MTLFDDIYGRTFPFAIGFDRTFQLLERAAQAPSVNYPPYNIVKVDDEHFTIELAVAGFSKKDISIKKEKEVLSVEGKKDDSNQEYVHRGLASREFRRSFTLADDVEIVGAQLLDGILSVDMKRVIPEADKPQLIKIK